MKINYLNNVSYENIYNLFFCFQPHLSLNLIPIAETKISNEIHFNWNIISKFIFPHFISRLPRIFLQYTFIQIESYPKHKLKWFMRSEDGKIVFFFSYFTKKILTTIGWCLQGMANRNKIFNIYEKICFFKIPKSCFENIQKNAIC